MTESIDAAGHRLAGKLMPLAGVTAVAVGEHRGKPCLRVWVERLDRPLSEAIPASFAGYAVIVEESGPLRALD